MPQQNGRVERKHQRLLNVARALRFHAGLPLSFWGECVMAASYLINRTPSVVFSGVTSYKVLFHSHLHLIDYGYWAVYVMLIINEQKEISLIVGRVSVFSWAIQWCKGMVFVCS